MALGAEVLRIVDGLNSRMTRLSFEKFNIHAPTPQATVDLFNGRWASALPDQGSFLESGASDIFLTDPRPRMALRAFGEGATELGGKTILELGPLEGGHTFQLESLGARITAIEGNSEAFLKCLIVKELYDLKSKFLFGDFREHMDQSGETYDLVFASGVLYHMNDPVRLISQICKSSPRSFVWTHYYDPDKLQGFRKEVRTELGVTASHFRRRYLDRRLGHFWGGLNDHACWLERDSIFAAFRQFGHAHIKILAEDRDHQHGPAFSFVTSATPLD